MSDIDSDFLAKHTYLSDGRPESLDERLAREVPDYVDPEVPYERQPDAIGALVSEPDEGPEDEPDEEQDILARAEGPARADVVDRDDDSGEFVFDADSGEFVFDAQEDEG